MSLTIVHVCWHWSAQKCLQWKQWRLPGVDGTFIMTGFYNPFLQPCIRLMLKVRARRQLKYMEASGLFDYNQTIKASLFFKYRNSLTQTNTLASKNASKSETHLFRNSRQHFGMNIHGIPWPPASHRPTANSRERKISHKNLSDIFNDLIVKESRINRYFTL